MQTPSSSTQARLDEASSARSSSTSSVDVGLGVAREVRLAVLVEALAAGLGAELALGDELLHALVDVEAVAVGLGEVLGDVQDGVEAEQVDEENGPIGATLRRADALVDLLDREALLLLRAPDLADAPS